MTRSGIPRSGFFHILCGKAVEKDRFRQGNARSCMNIARIAQEFVMAAIPAFSMS
jgi:hypothetical protein